MTFSISRYLVVGIVAATSVASCILQTETVSGPPGSPGDVGAQGPPGNSEVTLDGKVLTVQELADLVADQQLAISALESRLVALEALSDPDCPSGYSATKKPFLPGNADSVLCTNDGEEMVKVGTGGTAFWVDRYEASIWEGSVQRFAGYDETNAGSTFPKNGQSNAPWVAKSLAGIVPASYVTWFQAQAACRASGKRLPSDEEWLAAARGTVDPGDNDGLQNNKCNTAASSPRPTGLAGAPATSSQTTGCFGDWGSEDMVGNLWERTSNWYLGVGDLSATYYDVKAWPAEYSDGDSTWNVSSAALTSGSPPVGLPGIPSSATRGGGFVDPSLSAGVFSFSVVYSPSYFGLDTGFRCVVDR